MLKVSKAILIVSVLTLLTGCGRYIDQNTDYTSSLPDGTFTAQSKYYNTFGYKDTLTLSVVKGIITQVNFKEVNSNGVERTEADIESRWTNLDESYSELKDSLYTDTILSQGKTVDAVSGATKTVSDYMILQEALIDNLEEGNTNPVTVDAFNDSFVVRNEIDPITGSQEELTVQINKGKIEGVQINEVTNNAAFYLIERAYKNLADMSEETHSLNPVFTDTVDPQILNRYNALLDQVATLRGKE